MKTTYKTVFRGAILILLCLAYNFTNAQQASYIKEDVKYVLILEDGTLLKGQVVSETEKEVVFNDNNIGIKTIERSKIKSLKPEYGTDSWVIKLVDGSIINGKIISKNDSITVIATKNIGTVTIRNDKIMAIKKESETSVTPSGQLRYTNPNATRYLFAPSAIPLKKGEGYYQNFYFLGNGVNYGVTKNFSIGGGLFGPFGVFITPKIGFKLDEYFYAGAGILLGNSFFAIDGDNFGFGLPYGVATIGNTEHNVTLGAGYGFANSFGSISTSERAIFVANGMTRVSRNFALVTENWFIPVDEYIFDNNNKSGYETFFSYAFRIMSERSTFDLGFINTPGLMDNGWYIGIPYVDFVYRFGNYKDNL